MICRYNPSAPRALGRHSSSLGIGLLGLSALMGCRQETLLGDYCAAPPQGVVQVGEASPEGVCPFSDGPCASEYYALPALAPAGTLSPIIQDTLETQFVQVRSGDYPIVWDELSNEQLAEAILDRSRIGWLVDGIETRSMRVSEVVRSDEPGARARQWQIEDPYVGRLRGVTLLPDGKGPFPAIVAAHGHTETEWDWINEHGGWELVERGFAVIVPTLRVNEADQDESDLTIYLLRSGMTFSGIRIYEHLLAQKFAASLPEVDPCRIGFIGHSGGSVAGNLTARVTVGFVAYVTDLLSDYYLEAIPNELWLDETAPDLWSISEHVNELDTAHIPILHVGYNYVTEEDPPGASQWPEVLDFMETHVANGHGNE